jgi:hypothetical protein
MYISIYSVPLFSLLLASHCTTTSSTISEVKAVFTAFPEAVFQHSPNPRPTVENFPEVGERPQSGIEAFKHEFVQAAVQEAMDESCRDMRRQLWHIHYDMIRAIQNQQSEVRSILKEYAVNPELLAEVQRLREENARLKNTPFIAHFNAKDSSPP